MPLSWITPKTDWDNTSKFTYADYNRIRNNLLYINEKLNEMYPDVAVELDLGNPKTGYADKYYPSEFNGFENALESFKRIGLNVNIGDKKNFKGNSPFILFSELNRIEKCCLRWKEAAVIRVESVSIDQDNPTDIWTKTSFSRETKQLTATILPANAANKGIKWSSSNTSVVTVSDTGLMTRVGRGTATVTVTTVDGNKTDSITVNVYYGVDSISLNPSKISLSTEVPFNLIYASITPSYATGYTISWSSSDTSVAKVDANGKVTAVSGGTATITATVVEPHFGNTNISATCEVVVTVSVESLKIVPEHMFVTQVGAYDFDIVVEPKSAFDEHYAVGVIENAYSGDFSVEQHGEKFRVNLLENPNPIGELTLQVTMGGKKATAKLGVGLGTWFVYEYPFNYDPPKMNSAYYDFIYLGSNLDGNGISTLLAHKVPKEFLGCMSEEGWGNGSLDENASYRGTVQEFINTYFSNDLKNHLMPATKKVLNGLWSTYDLSAKFHLIGYHEVEEPWGGSSTALDMTGTTYSYFMNNPTRWRDGLIGDISGYDNTKVIHTLSRGTIRHRTGEIKPTTTYYTNKKMSTGSLYSFDTKQRLRPLFFLSNDTRVIQNGNEYIIDWTNQSATKLSTIPVGSYVVDKTGTR